MLLPNIKIRLPGLEHEIAIDHAKANLCFVSHAHSDHTAAVRARKNVFATGETLHLAGARNAHPIPKGISLLPAGHMLGASQLHAQLDGSTLTYTGDFKLSQSFRCAGAKVKE